MENSNQAIVRTSQIEELIEEMNFLNTDIITELKEQKSINNELMLARQAVEAVSVDTNALCQVYELVNSAEQKLANLNELKDDISNFRNVASEDLSEKLLAFKFDLKSHQEQLRSRMRKILNEEVKATVAQIRAENENLEKTRAKISTTNQVMCDNIDNLEKLNKSFQKKNNLYLMKYLIIAFFSSMIIIFAYFSITTKVEQNAKIGFNGIKNAVVKQMRKNYKELNNA